MTRGGRAGPPRPPIPRHPRWAAAALAGERGGLGLNVRTRRKDEVESGAVLPDDICLLQQTSAAAYDAAGNVTASIDAMGHVYGNDLQCHRTGHDDQGQVVNSVARGLPNHSLGSPSTWTFSNLAPNNQSSYDVYVFSATDLEQCHYTVVDQNNNQVAITPNGDRALWVGWYDLGA